MQILKLPPERKEHLHPYEVETFCIVFCRPCPALQLQHDQGPCGGATNCHIYSNPYPVPDGRACFYRTIFCDWR